MECSIDGKDYYSHKRLGSGGNGAVYKLLEKGNPKASCIYVVKILNKLESKRYHRFKKEVEVQSKGIEGVMPIIKYDLPEEASPENPPWYIMPYAKELKDELSTENKGEKKLL